MIADSYADKIHGSLSSPAILLISISSLISLVFTVIVCTCCCKKKIKKDDEEDVYSAVNFKKNPNLAVLSGKETGRVGGTEKDSAVGQPLLAVGGGVVNGGGGGSDSKNTLLRALPSLPSVPPQPVFPENNRTAALVHSSKELNSSTPGTLTRESSTSELYATVQDKPAAPNSADKSKEFVGKDVYSKIRRKPEKGSRNATYDTIDTDPDPDPLYSKVDDLPPAPPRLQNSKVAFNHSRERQYEYPTFTGRKNSNETEKVAKAPSSVDPRYERVVGPYSVVDSEDPYSSIRSDTGKERNPEAAKGEEIYQAASSTTSSSEDYPRYAKIHKKRSSEPNMGILTEEGVPVIPNRLEDELAVDYLYAKVRRRHSDSSDFAREGIRVVEAKAGVNTVVDDGAIVASGSRGHFPNATAVEPTLTKARLLSGRAGRRLPGQIGNEDGGLPSVGDQREPSLLGVRGSTGGSSSGGREPSYKYITVRESVETLRQRLAQQLGDRDEDRRRPHSNPSLHYYSTISENSYEVVPENPSAQQGVYEDLTFVATGQNGPSQMVNCQRFRNNNVNVTTVQIDTMDSGRNVEGSTRNIGRGQRPTPPNTIELTEDRPPEPPTSPIPTPLSSYFNKGPFYSTPKTVSPQSVECVRGEVTAKSKGDKVSGSETKQANTKNVECVVNGEDGQRLSGNRDEMVVSVEFDSEKSLSLSGHSNLQISLSSSSPKDELLSGEDGEEVKDVTVRLAAIDLRGENGDILTSVQKKELEKSVVEETASFLPRWKRPETPRKGELDGSSFISLTGNLGQKREDKDLVKNKSGFVPIFEPSTIIGTEEKSRIRAESPRKEWREVSRLKNRTTESHSMSPTRERGINVLPVNPGSLPESPKKAATGKEDSAQGITASVENLHKGKVRNSVKSFSPDTAEDIKFPSPDVRRGKNGCECLEKVGNSSKRKEQKREREDDREGKNGAFHSEKSDSKVYRGLGGEAEDDHANCFCHARKPDPEAVFKENISVMEKFQRMDSKERVGEVNIPRKNSGHSLPVYRL